MTQDEYIKRRNKILRSFQQAVRVIVVNGLSMDTIESAQEKYQQAIDELVLAVIGEDRKCEKNHVEYFDWCSYCDIERVRAEWREVQYNIVKGGE
jgi:hypothetical protein